MRRCLIVSTTYVEPTHRGKLRALAARGLEVTAAVPQRWPEPVLGRSRPTAWERQAGVEVFPLPVRGNTTETATFGGRELKALLRDKRPDVVQVEESATTPLAAQVADAARRAGLAVVMYVDENVAPTGSLWSRRRRRRLLHRAKGVLAGGDAAATLVRTVRPDGPVAVVRQLGVAVPATAEHEPHPGLAIAAVGRLEHRRGFDTLLAALATLRDTEWSLTVVGDGPERERLENIANGLRLASRVRWSGVLPPAHLARLWPTLDVLVAPSRRMPDWEDPSADAVAEAMGHEVAVVGTAAGVVPEVIGDAGIVVPPEDVPALAAALVRLAIVTERRPLAQAARARAIKEWSDEAVAERTLAFWKEILQ